MSQQGCWYPSKLPCPNARKFNARIIPSSPSFPQFIARIQFPPLIVPLLLVRIITFVVLPSRILIPDLNR